MISTFKIVCGSKGLFLARVVILLLIRLTLISNFSLPNYLNTINSNYTRLLTKPRIAFGLNLFITAVQ